MDCSVDDLREFLAGPSVYQSCIKAWSRPILSPMVTQKTREEMRKNRDQAIEVEEKCKSHHKNQALSTNVTHSSSNGAENVFVATIAEGAKDAGGLHLAKRDFLYHSPLSSAGDDVQNPGSSHGRTCLTVDVSVPVDDSNILACTTEHVDEHAHSTMVKQFKHNVLNSAALSIQSEVAAICAPSQSFSGCIIRVPSHSSESASQMSDISMSDDFNRNVTSSTSLDKYMNSQADTLTGSSIQDDESPPRASRDAGVASERNHLQSAASLVSLCSTVSEMGQALPPCFVSTLKETDESSLLGRDCNSALLNQPSDHMPSVSSTDCIAAFCQLSPSAVSTLSGEANSSEESTLTISTSNTEQRSNSPCADRRSAPKLLRRHSFTLDKPSPILLLAHERCGNVCSSNSCTRQCCCPCLCSPQPHGFCSGVQSDKDCKMEHLTEVHFSSSAPDGMVLHKETCIFGEPAKSAASPSGYSNVNVGERSPTVLPGSEVVSRRPSAHVAESVSRNLMVEALKSMSSQEVQSNLIDSAQFFDATKYSNTTVKTLLRQRVLADKSGTRTHPMVKSLTLPDTRSWSSEEVKQMLHALQEEQSRWLETMLQHLSEQQLAKLGSAQGNQENVDCTIRKESCSPNNSASTAVWSRCSSMSSKSFGVTGNATYNPSVYQTMFSADSAADDPCHSETIRKDQQQNGNLCDPPSTLPAKMNGNKLCTSLQMEPSALSEKRLSSSRATTQRGILLPPEALDPAMKPKFDRLTATVKGYLTRRLIKTERVQSIIQTIKDTLLCTVEIYEDSSIREDELTSQDVELHRRLLSQLTAAIHAFHDIFFKLSTAEKMTIIAQSRTKAQASQEKDVMPSGHRATPLPMPKFTEKRKSKPKGHLPGMRRSSKPVSLSADGRVAKVYSCSSGREMTRKTMRCERKSPCSKKDSRETLNIPSRAKRNLLC